MLGVLFSCNFEVVVEGVFTYVTILTRTSGKCLKIKVIRVTLLI